MKRPIITLAAAALCAAQLSCLAIYASNSPTAGDVVENITNTTTEENTTEETTQENTTTEENTTAEENTTGETTEGETKPVVTPQAPVAVSTQTSVVAEFVPVTVKVNGQVVSQPKAQLESVDNQQIVVLVETLDGRSIEIVTARSVEKDFRAQKAFFEAANPGVLWIDAISSKNGRAKITVNIPAELLQGGILTVYGSDGKEVKFTVDENGNASFVAQPGVAYAILLKK